MKICVNATLVGVRSGNIKEVYSLVTILAEQFDFQKKKTSTEQVHVFNIISSI